MTNDLRGLVSLCWRLSRSVGIDNDKKEWPWVSARTHRACKFPRRIASLSVSPLSLSLSLFLSVFLPFVAPVNRFVVFARRVGTSSRRLDADLIATEIAKRHPRLTPLPRYFQ